MRESDAVETARRALGAQLAAYRRAAGHSQAHLARLAGYSRSTIANVETGRQHVPRDFWTTVDEALHAEGTLTEANDQIETAVRREHEDAARQAAPFLPALASSSIPAAAQEPTRADDNWQDVIAAAASQAREHAGKTAVTEIGPGTVEQLTADVVRLGRAYVSAAPLPLFAAMHQTLAQIQTAIDRKVYPAQAHDLNFLAGAVCGLMANASLDLGRDQAADDLARAAWTYGQIIDYGPLMGWARGTQALAALWDHRYLDAIHHAENGLTDIPAGMGTIRLHAIRARALAESGDRAQATAALTTADKARDDTQPDDLHHGLAGEFTFSNAKLHYYKSLVLIDNEDPAQAAQAAAAAIRLYQSAPARNRSYGCEALARIQLAKTQLMTSKIDHAASILSGVLALNPQMRIDSIAQQLQTCRCLLTSVPHRNFTTARQLDRRIAAFTDASAMHPLPGR